MQDGARPDKEVVSLPIDAELLERAKDRQVDLAQLLERALRRELPEDHEPSDAAKEWQRDNAEAISSWNQELEKNGLWSEGRRLF